MSLWKRIMLKIKGFPPLKMTVSDNGMAFLKEVEGWEKKPYIDEAGHLTIGCGHKLTKEELDTGLMRIGNMHVAWRAGLTDLQILALKARDAIIVENAINKEVTVPLTQNQFDALAAFIFNVGVAGFRKSTLLKKLNGVNYDDVPLELIRYVYATDKNTGKKFRSVGLENRRAKEVSLWRGHWKPKEVKK